MRPIKFRVWNGEDMISPDYIDRSGTAWWKENSIPTSSKDLMQFTGLVDKNGVEIWEGDIVKEGSFTYVVGYAEAQFDPFGMPSEGGHEWDRVRPKDCEVIGNGFQPPELM